MDDDYNVWKCHDHSCAEPCFKVTIARYVAENCIVHSDHKLETKWTKVTNEYKLLQLIELKRGSTSG